MATARSRPTRAQMETLVEEFSVNAYRMMGGRNIGNILVELAPAQGHPYFYTLMNPGVDFFPRALVVLAHATLESTARNVLKLLHPTRSAGDLDEHWSASHLGKITKSLEVCKVLIRYADVAEQQWVEGQIGALMERRHRIAHHADLPDDAALNLALATNVLTWCAAAVRIEARILASAFPEFANVENADLVERIDAVLADWNRFIGQLLRVPDHGANLGRML